VSAGRTMYLPGLFWWSSGAARGRAGLRRAIGRPGVAAVARSRTGACNTRPFEMSLGILPGVAVAWRAGNRREPVRYMGACPRVRAGRADVAQW
jgi:hypothetical protein